MATLAFPGPFLDQFAAVKTLQLRISTCGVGANLCWMPDLTFDPQLFHQVQKPVHRSSGFNPHTHRAWSSE